MKFLKILIIPLVFLFFLLSNNSVLATNGCFDTDPECGSNPIDNCDVRQNTTFSPGVYDLPNGIDICANNIVLDCNGATIMGNGTVPSDASGLTVNEKTNTTIKNCKIFDFISYTGVGVIRVINSPFTTISNNKLELESSGYGIYIYSSYNTNITNNTIISISSTSSAAAIVLDLTNFGSISNNNLDSNSYGIGLSSSNFNIVSNNNLKSNKVGISTLHSSNNDITNNAVINSDVAIEVKSGSAFSPSAHYNTISNNNLKSNKFGISNFATDNTKITNNTIINSSSFGLQLLYGWRDKIEKNTITLSNWGGISIYGDGVFEFNNIYNNTLNLYNAREIDITAENNWWGTTNKTEIEQSIFDFFDESTRGIVDFEPYLFSPFVESALIITGHIQPTLVGQFTSNQLGVIGGISPYNWSIVSGSFPEGIQLHQDGVINGTPIQSGSFTFTLGVIDSRGKIGERQFTQEVYVTLPPPEIKISKVGTRAVPGRIIDYFIAIQNIGIAPAQNISIIEFLETIFFNLTSTNPLASKEIIDDEETTIEIIVWNTSTLLQGEIKIFSYRALLDSSTPIGTEVIGGPACEKRRKPCSDPIGSPDEEFPFLPIYGNDLEKCSKGGGGGDGGYRCRSDGGHEGVDIKADIGTPVLAIDDGIVIHAGCGASGCDKGLGKFVAIRHNNGAVSIYAHLSSIGVAPLQIVPGGTIIGLTGDSGNAKNLPCKHLHFEYRAPNSKNDVPTCLKKSSERPNCRSVNPCRGLGIKIEVCSCPCTEGSCSENRQNAARAYDPNEKVVTPSGFIKNTQELVYTIHFENIGNTSALDIFITDVLDSNLNISTLEVLDYTGTFVQLTGNTQITLFSRQKNKTLIIDPENNITVNITIDETWTANLNNRTIEWSLLGIDLDVNATGEVIFKIFPNQGLSSGKNITNNATIQFEIFESITTNNTLNIIDETIPSCTVQPLPSKINNTELQNFTIYWNYTDQIGEADFFTIFASLNNGGYTQLITTANNNATINGISNTTYQFICIAKDTAGNTEVQPPIPEATTFISGNNRPVLGFIGDQQINEGQTLIINLEGFDFDNQTLIFDTNAATILPTSFILNTPNTAVPIPVLPPAFTSNKTNIPISITNNTFTFNKTTGLFTWTPSLIDAGVYEITFNITDGQPINNVDTQTITITVIK